MKMSWKRMSLSWLAVVAVLAVDRVTKQLAEMVLAETGAQTVWPGVLGWRYARNTGAAFSAFDGYGMVLSAVTALIILLAGLWYLEHQDCNGFLASGLTLLIAGGLGNLYDRLTLGYVIDFIEVLFMRFAIFNVADVAVVCGTICLVIGILKTEGKAI